jgi:hypothetical protein
MIGKLSNNKINENPSSGFLSVKGRKIECHIEARDAF